MKRIPWLSVDLDSRMVLSLKLAVAICLLAASWVVKPASAAPCPPNATLNAVCKTVDDFGNQDCESLVSPAPGNFATCQLYDLGQGEPHQGCSQGTCDE